MVSVTEDSQSRDWNETQPAEFDPRVHPPPIYQPSKVVDHTPILKSSLLVKAPPFDEEALNLEFQAEYDALEQRSRQLDLNFQNLLKDLRIWISASIEPITDEAKMKIAEEVENIKTMEGTQEKLRIRIVECMRTVEAALSLLNHA